MAKTVNSKSELEDILVLADIDEATKECMCRIGGFECRFGDDDDSVEKLRKNAREFDAYLNRRLYPKNGGLGVQAVLVFLKDNLEFGKRSHIKKHPNNLNKISLSDGDVTMQVNCSLEDWSWTVLTYYGGF